MKFVKKLFFILFLVVALHAAPASALVGDGGTIAACYPGGFQQILLGVKPFILPCAQFTPIGQCYHKGQPWAALAVFWLPVYAIEVTGHANTTVFPKSLGDILAPDSLLGLTRSGSMIQGEAGNDIQTKYREAHIYELSTSDVAEILAGHPALTCMLKSVSSPNGKTVFRSEAYPGWRLGKDLTGIINSLNPLESSVGAWGPLYPRTGWSMHPSNITNSLLLSYRAQHLGSELSALRRGTQFVDKYEIGGPIPGTCNQIGAPTILQEKNANRPLCADRVVTIYWRLVVTCCNFGTF